MTGEQLFAIAIAGIVVIVVAYTQVSKHRKRIQRIILNRLNYIFQAVKLGSRGSEQHASDRKSSVLTTEAESEAELERIQKQIEDRKQIAWDTDVSYHLWGFYKNHFRQTNSQSLNRFDHDGEWYEVKILKASTANNLNKYEFELNDARYTFVDDEENQGWSDNRKTFSLFLYDDSGRCLIEIPMKVRVDKWGRNYSVLSDGPKAFLPGDWVSNFINVTLKHQRIRNQEIRAQKHQERLDEIKDLKDRFGISD